MKITAGLMFAVMTAFLVAGCGKESSQPHQTAQPTSAEGTSQEAPPQDFVEVDQQPEVIKKVAPLYPELARKAGLEGAVWVKIWIDTAGKPKQVTILKSDADVFNQVTIDAAKQFEFKPARIKDRPVSVWVSLPFKYKLGDKPQSQEAKAEMKSASPEEKSFMKGYVAAKEDLLSDFEKIAASAREKGKPNAELEQRIQKLKTEIPALKEALRAMQEAR